MDEFILKMNYPYGRLPTTRLQAIHGYHNDQTTLIHVLDDNLFVEFELHYLPDDETSDFEHIHNKAIFDTLNEVLNSYRPFYIVGGLPYTWSVSEKQLTVIIFDLSNIDVLLDRARENILEYASMLCGLISVDDG
jgi:hypothetical protein